MEKNKLNILLITGNTIAIIATIIVNALAVTLPINGKTTQELSDALPNLFVPSGITFSIWSIIYVFLIIFMFYQIIGFLKKDQSDMTYIEKIGAWFILLSLANIIWIILWHYEQVTISLIAMLVLFLSLLMIYQRLNIGLSKSSLKEKIAVHTTISIYIGWITVATIANVTAVLVKLDVGELVLGQVTWTILVIAVATLITMLIILGRKDILYSLVIIWALLGIIIKRLSDDPIYGVQTNIAIAAAISIIIIFATIVVKTILISNKKRTSS